MKKICSSCGNEKSIENFHKRGDRWKSHCKECRSQKENDKSRDRMKKYRDSNIEILRKRNLEYYHNQDKTIRNERQKQYFTDHPDKRLLHNLRCRISKCVTGKSTRTKDLLGCEYNELLHHIESLFKDGMRWDNYGEWHIDHIVPCSAFDFTNESEIAICFHYMNLQPLWAKENLIKSNKI